MNAWPFLIGKNKRLDYGVIAAPDFLMGVEGILADTTIGDIIDDGALYREIETEKTGPLTLIYRKYRPIDENNQPLTDRVGRKFKVTEGLVIQGHKKPQLLNISEAEYNRVMEGMKSEFQQFYFHATKEQSINTTSTVLSFGFPKLQLFRQEPYPAETVTGKPTAARNVPKYDVPSSEYHNDRQEKKQSSNAPMIVAVVVVAGIAIVVYLLLP